ncbi:hypothetical protein [Luedemannella flava]
MPTTVGVPDASGPAVEMPVFTTNSTRGGVPATVSPVWPTGW